MYSTSSAGSISSAWASILGVVMRGSISSRSILATVAVVTSARSASSAWVSAACSLPLQPLPDMNYRGRHAIRPKACSTSERQLLEYALVNEGQLVDTGEKDGRSRIVITHYRTTQGTGTNQDQGSPRLGEDTGYRTVAGLFADPPGWLPKQLEVYCENPRKHIGPLCAAVSAVVLGDGTLGHEAREEVERELAK